MGLIVQCAGGIAYVGVFGFSDYQQYSPAFVYFNNLGPREDFVAEGRNRHFFHGLLHR